MWMGKFSKLTNRLYQKGNIFKIAIIFIIFLVCLSNFYIMVALTFPCYIQSEENSTQIKNSSEAYYISQKYRKKLLQDVEISANQVTKTFSRVSNLPFHPEGSITRAIITFLPFNNSQFNIQLKFHYLSLAYVRTLQSQNIKTDLLVFTPHNNDEFLLELGCTKQKRASFEDAERCTIMHFVPLEERLAEDGPDSLKPYEKYINSMLILSEFDLGERYDFVLRTDLDSFIAPGFANWMPRNFSALAVGLGGYGSKNAELHLRYVSKQLNLNYGNLGGLGSTWYGNTELMVATANLTISIMRWLTTQEFSAFEKCCSGVESWPHWHWPVILLYGGHIALNHLGPEGVMLSNSSYPEFDHQSTRQTEMNSEVKHIHCWHSDDLFSKFKFLNDEYKSENLESYREMKTPSHYSAMIAISSSRLGTLEFRQLVSHPSAMKELKWVRLYPFP